MENRGFLLDALLTCPAETSAWLQTCTEDSCERVAADVASAITSLKLAQESGVRQCRASVRTAAKFVTASREGLRNVAAALDAIASLCASALASSHEIEAAKAALEEGRRGRTLASDLQQAAKPCWSAELDVDADADAGGPDFKQWADIVALDGRQFVCAVDNDRGKDTACATWARGQHSFIVRVNVMTVDLKKILAVLHLPPDAVTVGIHGDDTATWTCAQHPDGRGVIATYTAAPQAVEVELTVHVLRTAVFTQRLVMEWEGRIRIFCATCVGFIVPLVVCRHLASVQGPAVSNAGSG